MRVAMFSSKVYDREAFLPRTEHEWVFVEARLSVQTALLAQGCNAICCFVNDDLSVEVLTALQQLGIFTVVLRCAGFNQVDVAAAKSLGIRVARVPEYSPFAVAEHAVALILTLNRKVHRAHNRIRENDYSLTGLMGFDLHGKTVGVVGAGKIGLAFLNIMAGFGCRLLVSDKYRNETVAELATYVELDALWRESDIISLHCPLSPDTHHLISTAELQRMKPGVMIINTSRGALVDAKALIEGLKSGQLGYLGLDVYEEEGDLFFEDLSDKVIQDDVFARLTTFPNVLITGHQAFFTREAVAKIVDVTIDNLNAIERQDWPHAKLIT